jgi:hypothetical protein
MTCTECNESILFQEEDITVHAVYSDGRIRRVCHHVASFDETDPTIIAILGSEDCAEKWLEKNPQPAGANHVN